MSRQQLKATERDTTITPRQLRSAGFLPATVYGGKATPQSIQVRTHEFELLYQKGHREFDLQHHDGSTISARAHQVQKNARTQQYENIEFLLTAS